MADEELSISDATLIASLRGWARDIQEGSKAIWAMDQDLKEAAARIEQLVATNERLEAALEGLLEYTADLNPLQGYDENKDHPAVKAARAALRGDDHE